jgi:hypothetical protein
MNLAVVLVSDQTIPNVVYLKNIENEWDKILFVTTESMENKSKTDTILKIFDDVGYDKILVDENRLFDIYKKLSDYFSKNKFGEIIVNITGGTKLMSLGVYNFFKQNSLVKNIVYLPINSINYKQIYPMDGDGRAIDIPINYKMDVDAYFNSIDVKIQSVSKPFNEELSIKLFDIFTAKKDVFFDLTKVIRNGGYRGDKKKRKKIRNSKDWNMIEQLLGKMGLKTDEFDFTKRDTIDYFSGGWFEEYVYLEALNLKDKCIDDVYLNVKIETAVEDASAPNELDVVFIRNNSLNAIECKSGDLSISQMTDVFYKVAYLNKTFGLSARSFIATLGSINEDILKRSRVFNIKLITLEDIEGVGMSKYLEETLCR